MQEIRVLQLTIMRGTTLSNKVSIVLQKSPSPEYTSYTIQVSANDLKAPGLNENTLLRKMSLRNCANLMLFYYLKLKA